MNKVRQFFWDVVHTIEGDVDWVIVMLIAVVIMGVAINWCMR